MVMLSAEEAAHELVELCHLRPRLKPLASSVCMPHYFQRALAGSTDRWAALGTGKITAEMLADGDYATLRDMTGLEMMELVQGDYAGVVDKPAVLRDGGWDHPEGVHFYRIKSRPAQLVHGAQASRALEVTTGWLNPKSQWSSYRDLLAFLPQDDLHALVHGPKCKCERLRAGYDPRTTCGAGAWCIVTRKGVHEVPSDMMTNLGLTAWRNLRRRYEWQLVFGFEECASVAVPVERDALPELVRVRDVPAGKKRRAALAHWVARHARRARSQAPTEDPSIWVRKHLRGERVFRWDGLVCEIEPPAFELETLARAQP